MATWVKMDKSIVGLVEEAEQGLQLYPAIPPLGAGSGLPVVQGGQSDSYYAERFESLRDVEVRATTTVHQTHGGTSTNIDNSVDNSVTYNISGPDQKSVEELADNLTKKLVEIEENRRKKAIRTFKETGANVAHGAAVFTGFLTLAVAAVNSLRSDHIALPGANVLGLSGLAGTTGAFLTEGVRWISDTLGPERPLPLNLQIQYGHVENRATNSGNEEANQSMVANAVQIFRGVGAENAARGRMPGYL